MNATPRVLLLLGPPGVGKTSIIRSLCERDARFVYIAPYTTRTLRPGEQDKFHVSEDALNDLWAAGELVMINELHGARYGTPRRLISQTLAAQRFPVIDWPVDRLEPLRALREFLTYAVYIAPRSLEQLASQLKGRDGRSEDRLVFAAMELGRFYEREFDSLIDCSVINDAENLEATVTDVYVKYIEAVTPIGE